MIDIPWLKNSNRPFVLLHLDHSPSFKKQHQSHALTKVWHSVTQLAKKFFWHFSFKRNAHPFHFSPRQVGLMKKERDTRRLFREKSVKALKPDTLTDPKESDRPLKTSSHDRSLEGLKEFLVQFAQIAVNECALQELIDPQMPDWKEAFIQLVASIPERNQALLTLKKSASPLLSRLKAFDDSAITLVIQQMLANYVSSDQKIVKAELLKHLEEMRDTERIHEKTYQRALNYIEPILTWLYYPNNWLVRSSHPTNLHHFISDSFRFIDALAIQIKNGKLAPFLEQLSTFINEDLEDQIHQACALNTKPLTQLLSSRLADLIEHLPYAEAYHHILRQIIDQVQGWIEADQVRQEQSQLITAAVQADRARPKIIEEITRQKEAQKLLSAVEEDGGERQYLEKKFHHAFAEHSACHPKMREILKAQTEEEKSKREKKFYRSFVDRVFPLFLPNKKSQLSYGLEMEVNGTASIIETIVYPDKLQQLKNSAIQLFEDVLKSSQIKEKNRENFKVYFFALIQILSAEYLQNTIKEMMSRGFQNLLAKAASKEYQYYLATEYIFPIMTEKILKNFVLFFIDRKKGIVAKHFHEMLQTNRDVCNESKALLDDLYDLVSGRLIDFDMEEAGIDRESFDQIAQPIIAEVYAFLSSQKGSRCLESITIAEVKGYLDQYFKVQAVSVNHAYAELVMPVLFQVGSLGGWCFEKIVGWFQSTINDLGSQALNPLSNHYEFLIDTIVDAASEHLLSADAIREILLSDDLSEEDSAHRDERAKENFPLMTRRVSAIFHDYVYCTLEEIPAPFIQYFTPKTAKIDGVIQDVFNKLLESSQLNINLLASCADRVIQSLGEAVESLNADRLVQDRVTLIQTPTS